MTNAVKNVVGRPRPDFLNRCFPDGIPNSPFADDGRTLLCNGDAATIKEGERRDFNGIGGVVMYHL